MSTAAAAFIGPLDPSCVRVHSPSCLACECIRLWCLTPYCVTRLSCSLVTLPVLIILQQVTAVAEIMTPPVVNLQLTNLLPFKAWSRSEYSHACFSHCQEFLPCPHFDHPFPPPPPPPQKNTELHTYIRWYQDMLYCVWIAVDGGCWSLCMWFRLW